VTSESNIADAVSRLNGITRGSLFSVMKKAIALFSNDPSGKTPV
jgi:hypothetical protein